MNFAVTKRFSGFSNPSALSFSSITFWIDGLCFLIALAFLAVVAPAPLVGVFAWGWALAIPWNYLSDVPAVDETKRLEMLPVKGVGFILGLVLCWGATLLLWGNLFYAAFATFAFLWKSLDSAEHLLSEKPLWFRELRGPGTLLTFYLLWQTTGLLDLAMIGAALWSLAHFWVMGWKEVGRLSWQSAWRLGKRFRGDDSALALASLLLLIPFLGVCLWYGPDSGANLALTGFWIFFGNWLWNKTHPQWGRYLKGALQEGEMESYAGAFLRFLGLGSLMGLALVLGIYLAGTLYFQNLMPDILRFHHGLFVGMTLAAGLFWINALFCLGRGVLPGSRAPWKFLSFWLVIQVGLSLFLIPHLGIEGASWTLVLTSALMIPHQWILLERDMRRHFEV